MPRANWRAVAPTTDRIISPSRRWTWKSSGRARVSVSAMRNYRGLFLHLQRQRVELVAPASREPGGDRHRLLDRQLREQRLQHLAGIEPRIRFHRPPLDHEHEFA